VPVWQVLLSVESSVSRTVEEEFPARDILDNAYHSESQPLQPNLVPRANYQDHHTAWSYDPPLLTASLMLDLHGGECSMRVLLSDRWTQYG
jgi:hypothetical protein